MVSRELHPEIRKELRLAMYTVYKHTTPSGKVYVGITQQKPEKRWKNGNGYKSNKHFYSAIKKYGWDNIKHEIICQAPMSVAQAVAVEKSFIALYDSTNPDKGYNHSIGGECSALGVCPSAETRRKISESLKGIPLSQETRRKISEAKKGINRSSETRLKISESNKRAYLNPELLRKISEANKGQIPWNKGKKGVQHHTSETRRKMSESNKGKTAKAVICVETGILYSSGMEAEKSTGISRKSISKVLRGVHKTSGGYHWKYAD